MTKMSIPFDEGRFLQCAVWPVALWFKHVNMGALRQRKYSQRECFQTRDPWLRVCGAHRICSAKLPSRTPPWRWQNEGRGPLAAAGRIRGGQDNDYQFKYGRHDLGIIQCRDRVDRPSTSETCIVAFTVTLGLKKDCRDPRSNSVRLSTRTAKPKFQIMDKNLASQSGGSTCWLHSSQRKDKQPNYQKLMRHSFSGSGDIPNNKEHAKQCRTIYRHTVWTQTGPNLFDWLRQKTHCYNLLFLLLWSKTGS